MVIRIRLETEEPPTGTGSVEGRAESTLPFVGWLGLLRVLSHLFSIESGAAMPETRRDLTDS